MFTKKNTPEPGSLNRTHPHESSAPTGIKETSKQASSAVLTPEPLKKNTTRLTIKMDCGFGNELYIRGDGAGLNWTKGAKLKNIDSTTWIWETDRPFTHCYVKILINDDHYENGENHLIKHGAHVTYTPAF